jgi:hypothetical protein
MQSKRVKIRPVARRIDCTRGELPPIDDARQVTSVSREEINLCNPRTAHNLRLGTDHVREYMTDPDGTDGLLILKSQVTLTRTQVSVEPLFAPPTSATGRERYDEWRELTDELHESLIQIGYAFLPANVITPGIEDNDYEAGIRKGYRAIRSRILIAQALERAGVLEKYEELVRYAVSADRPRDPAQRGSPTAAGFDMKATAFQNELMKIARKDMGV